MNLFKKKEAASIGFWERFAAVFTPTFLVRLGTEKKNGKSWGFWFLSNFFLVLIPFIAITITAVVLLAHFPGNAVNNIPEEITFELPDGTEHNIKDLVQNFEFTINENFELETENVPDPLIFYISEDEEVNFVNDVAEISDEAEFVFVLDTKDKKTDSQSIGKFENAFFLLHDMLAAVDGNDHNIEIIRYADTIGGDADAVFPMSFDLETIADSTPLISKVVFYIIASVFVMAYLFVAVARLVFALLWALIFWGVGEIARVKEWSFEKSFMAMLHYGFVTLLFCPLFLIMGLNTFWSGAIMLSVLFGMNFYHMKKA